MCEPCCKPKCCEEVEEVFEVGDVLRDNYNQMKLVCKTMRTGKFFVIDLADYNVTSNEHKSLQEFTEHYKSLGFTKFGKFTETYKRSV